MLGYQSTVNYINLVSDSSTSTADAICGVASSSVLCRPVEITPLLNMASTFVAEMSGTRFNGIDRGSINDFSDTDGCEILNRVIRMLCVGYQHSLRLA